MSTWAHKTLGEFISLQRGYDLTADEQEPGDVPVMGAAGHNGFHSKAKASAPGIIVGRSGGSFGQVHMAHKDFWPHNTAMYVSDFKGNDTYFVYYFLKNLNFSSFNSGSAQPSLNRNYIYPIKISVPSPAEQKKISAVLCVLDAKIDLNNRINAELEAMAKTLYDYWFVQFDFPDENGKPYKSSGGKMEYNPTLKRHIPIGWECKAIPDLLTIRTGKEDANFASEKGIYPFFTCGEEMLYCDIAVFSGKAILLAGNGNFAVRVYDGEFNAYQRTYVLIPENEHYYSVVYYAVRDKIKTLTKGSRGSIIKFITKGDIEDIKLALPEEGLLLNCFERLNNVAEKISINSKENQQLTQLRDWLLPMLMNGQAKVA